MKYSSLIIALLLATTFSVNAQKTLSEDTEFFYEAFEEYKTWIEDQGYDKQIRATDMQVGDAQNMVLIDLKTTDAKAWLSLCQSYEEQNDDNFREVLFVQAMFVFQLEKEQVGLRLSADSGDHFMKMYFSNGELKIDERKNKNIDNLLTIPLIKLSGNGVIEGKGSVEHTKDLLKGFVYDYFNPKDFPGIDVRVSEFNENRMYIVVKNMKDEVLEEKYLSYFEWLTIDATIKEKNGKIELKYNLKGKYSQNIFGRRYTGYYDIYKYEKSYLEDYNAMLKGKIDAYIRDKD